MTKLDYIYSRLSSESVCNLIGFYYDLLTPLGCQFYVLGLHDNYLVDTEQGKYILRIYRNDWRSEEEILFELDLLDYLQKKNTGIAGPLCTAGKELHFSVETPEGVRLAALFNFADGRAPCTELSVRESELLGKVVANIHLAGTGFASQYHRPKLDISYLVDEQLELLDSYIDSDGMRYLESVQKKIHDQIPGLTDTPGVFGICTGDVNPSNFHINEEEKITLFDFDQCGFGYRAFEIGKFFSSIYTRKDRDELAQAFLSGYQDLRRLDQAELQALPYFEIASVIWVMGIHASNADRIGQKYLGGPFWERRLEVVKELELSLP